MKTLFKIHAPFALFVLSSILCTAVPASAQLDNSNNSGADQIGNKDQIVVAQNSGNSQKSENDKDHLYDGYDLVVRGRSPESVILLVEGFQKVKPSLYRKLIDVIASDKQKNQHEDRQDVLPISAFPFVIPVISGSVDVNVYGEYDPNTFQPVSLSVEPQGTEEVELSSLVFAFASIKTNDVNVVCPDGSEIPVGAREIPLDCVEPDMAPPPPDSPQVVIPVPAKGK